MNPKQKQSKSWMIQQLSYRKGDYLDSGGEFNCSKLAEDCAFHFGIYVDEVNEDCTIPEWLFDLAVDVAETFEKDYNL